MKNNFVSILMKIYMWIIKILDILYYKKCKLNYKKIKWKYKLLIKYFKDSNFKISYGFGVMVNFFKNGFFCGDIGFL